MERPFPKCSPFFTIIPGKNFLDVSIFRPQSETPLQESPLSRRIRSLSFFPCMNPKNFL